MSVTTNQNQSSQPFEVEELIRSLDEVPEISPELRSRILVASSQAAASAKRQKGWVIVAGFAATCAACVLAFAFFGMNTGAPEDSMADGEGSSYRSQETINDTVNQHLNRQGEIISGGMAPSGLRP